MNYSIKWVGAILLAFAIASAPAFAEPPQGKGKTQEKSHGKAQAKGDDKSGGNKGKSRVENNKAKHGEHGDKDRVLISLGNDRIDEIRIRLSPYYTKHCPPGLAKKRNGCLPPGQAKKYHVGGIYDGHFWDVPSDVITLLPAAPHGARYIWVDRDILLISEATKKILDATVILSAL